MGKNEDELVLSTLPSSSSLEISNGESSCIQCRLISRIVSLRCVFTLVFGLAVFLSAAFWLLPFISGKGGRDLDPLHGAYVAASFRVRRPVSLLNTNIAKLQYDIYDELSIPDISVAVISLEPLAESNWTNVVFGIWPYSHTTISPTWLSILKEYFMNFVTEQSTLHLTTSLFGSSYSFQVLRFPGGITVIPHQNVFLLQRVQMLFKFSLNFPMYKVQDNFDELVAQMKSGLHLNPYENLYVCLTNIEGSTVSPPTVIETSIVLKVGNKEPSKPRLRQLVQTIKRSSVGNLGLNHTVFGRVKQIQLSSYLNHSLSSPGDATSIPPSPAPQPQKHDHHHHLHHHHGHHHHHLHHHHGHHHYHHRHHHHHHHESDLTPVSAPQHSVSLSTPKSNSLVPAASPVDSPVSPSAPAPHLYHTHLPHVFLMHARPPIESGTDITPTIPAVSPSPISSSVAAHPSPLRWILVALLYLLAHLH